MIHLVRNLTETGDAQRVLLLSASNDGWVALWDAGLVDARGQPKCITRSNAMHSKGGCGCLLREVTPHAWHL